MTHFDFSPDSLLGQMERAMDGMACKCGGTISMANSVMMCSRCGYNATILISLGDEEGETRFKITSDILKDSATKTGEKHR